MANGINSLNRKDFANNRRVLGGAWICHMIEALAVLTSGYSMMKLAFQSRRNSGFTLIELLVVIAIIAILASILMPVLASAQRRAQQINCISNLKQLSTASLLYVADNHVWLGPMNSNYSLSQGDWMGTLLDYYARLTNMVVCPTAPPRVPPTTTNPAGTADYAWWWTLTTQATPPTPPFYGSYAYNSWMETKSSTVMNNSESYPQYLYQTEITVRYPTQTPMFCDGAWLNLDPLESDTPAANFYAPGYSMEGMPRVCVDRHGGIGAGSAPQNVPATMRPLPGKIDMSFVDGHAELVMIQSLWSYYWHLNWHATAPPAG
jgi:prepilin-type N-terminal cleavage/methylation domain-containing protein